MPRSALVLLAITLLSVSTAHRAEAQGIRILDTSPKADYPTQGPDDAPVTLEFFLHLGDRRSAAAYQLVDTLVARHPKRLRVVYRLTETSSRSSSLAQNFGMEAFAQGRFFEFLDSYYKARTSIPLTSMYPEVAKEAGVNYKRVLKSLETMEHEAVLRENHYYWTRLQINLIPGFRFNGSNAERVRTIEQLEGLYDASYAEAMRRRAFGILPEHIASRISADHEEERYAARRSFSGPSDGELTAGKPTKPQRVSMATLVSGARFQGAESADVTLVFVCNFQSILCSYMSRKLEDIRKAYPEDVRIVFRPLFDPTAPGQDIAALMHQAALCADEQSAFWEFYRRAFESHRRINFDQSLAVELASSKALNLDVPQFEECLESGRHLEELAKEMALVRAAGIQNTPRLIVDGIAYPGRLHFADMRMLVNHALRPGFLERLGSP